MKDVWIVRVRDEDGMFLRGVYEDRNDAMAEAEPYVSGRRAATLINDDTWSTTWYRDEVVIASVSSKTFVPSTANAAREPDTVACNAPVVGGTKVNEALKGLAERFERRNQKLEPNGLRWLPEVGRKRLLELVEDQDPWLAIRAIELWLGERWVAETKKDNT